MKDLKQATNWYRKALETYERLGDTVTIAIMYYNLGVVAEDLGDIDLALNWYEKASQKFKQYGICDREAQALSRIGQVYTKQDDAETGLVYTLKSFSLRLEIRAPQLMASMNQLLMQQPMLGDVRWTPKLDRWGC